MEGIWISLNMDLDVSVSSSPCLGGHERQDKKGFGIKIIRRVG